MSADDAQSLGDLFDLILVDPGSHRSELADRLIELKISRVGMIRSDARRFVRSFPRPIYIGAPRAWAEQAREFLLLGAPDADVQIVPSASTGPTCPVCRSKDVRPLTASDKVQGYLETSPLSFPEDVRQLSKTYVCMSCNTRF